MVPEGWSITKLSDLADVKRGAGSQYLTYVDEPDEGIRLIRIGDFLGDNPKFVSHTLDMDRFILKKGDILIAGTGATAGITFEVPEHFEGYAFSYNAPRIRPKKHVDKVYLVNFLKSNEITKQQRSLFTGNAQPFLDTKAIGGFKISTPPLPEQRKIADILSTWDVAIEKTEALLATAKAQKRALMQSLLTGKRRFSEFDGQPWKEVPLDAVATIRKGQQKSKSTLSATEDYPVINGGVGPSGYTDEWNAEAGTITISEGGNSCGYVNLIDARFWSGGHCYTLENLNVRRDFLFHDLKFREATIMGLRVGSGLPNIQKKAVSGLHVAFPSEPEQRRIEEILNVAYDTEKSILSDIVKLRTEKKALMQQLLTGNRRVSV